MSGLQFHTMWVKDFKALQGKQIIKLDPHPGLYYVTGINKLDPELGANGVGKSTIWDCLMWVLWGKTGRDNRPAAAVQPWGSSESTQVRLSFTRNGATRWITRGRNPNLLQYERSGEGPKEITQDQIPTLIGMSEELFRRTIVLSQFGSLFLDLDPEPQAKMFTDALGLDVWIDAAARATAAIRLCEKAIAEEETKRASHNAALDEVDATIARIKERRESFEADREQQLAAIRKLLRAAKDKLADLPQQKKPDPTKEKVVLKELAKARTALEDASSEWAETKAKLDHIDGQIDDIRHMMKRKNMKCPACNQPVTLNHLSDELDRLGDKSKALWTTANWKKVDEKKAAKRITDLNNQLQGWGDRMRDWSIQEVEVKALNNQIKSHRDDIEKVNKLHDHFDDEKEVQINRRAKLRGLVQKCGFEITKLNDEKYLYSFWQEGFREIRLSIIDNVLLELEMSAARHAAMLGLEDWGVKFDTEKESKGGTTTPSFTVLLYPPDQKEPVKWKSYSGGESQRWQLAVAFALSEVLLARAGLQPNVEVLDEPTRGLSPEGIDDLVQHLRERALDLKRAIFFVDHHSLDKGDFDKTLVIEKSSKGVEMQWV